MSQVIDSLEVEISKGSDIRGEFKKFWALATALLDDGIAFKLTLNPVKLERSLKQNRLMWCLLRDISAQVIWHGLKLDSEDWKNIITASWRGQRNVPNIEGTGFVMLGVSTKKLSVKEMGEVLDVIQAFGNEQGVKFSAPKWMYEL